MGGEPIVDYRYSIEDMGIYAISPFNVDTFDTSITYG